MQLLLLANLRKKPAQRVGNARVPENLYTRMAPCQRHNKELIVIEPFVNMFRCFSCVFGVFEGVPGILWAKGEDALPRSSILSLCRNSLWCHKSKKKAPHESSIC